MASRTGWEPAAVLVAALGVIHCGGDTSSDDDDNGGTGTGIPSTSTMMATGGSAGMTSAAGGMGGSSGPGGSGGAAFQPLEWTEPPLHLEEICRNDVPTGAFVTFDIPANTLGFTLAPSSPDVNELVAVFELRKPGQLRVIDDYSVEGKDADTFVDIGTVAAANPQSDLPQASPVPGTWQAVFQENSGSGLVDVCFYARRTSDGVFHNGVMDVNVRIAPGAGVNNTYMQGVLNELFGDYYGPSLGITQGTVTFGTIASSFDTINDNDEFATLLRTSAGIGPRPAVNVYVVDNFSNAEFGSAIGVAGGVPGTPMIHGTAQSGVAYTPGGDQNFDARVLAHEIGHLGGLFHTTELDASATDPLDDTPECPDIVSDPGSCPDDSNVMFPTAGGTGITADQRTVLRASTLYRGIVSSGGSPGSPLSIGSSSETSIELVAALSPISMREPEDAAERLLSGIWCAHGGTDYEAIVERVVRRARLLELAADENAFDMVRSRSLRVLERFSTASTDAAEVVVLAQAAARSKRSGRMLLRTATELLALQGY